VTAYGATLSFPRVPAKVPSPSDLPTFVIAVCHHGESHNRESRKRRNAAHFLVGL